MKLRIVGDAVSAGPERWPEPMAPATPVRVVFDVRGRSHDRALLAELRRAGLAGPVLLAQEGATLRQPLEEPLGPGTLLRGHGPALVAAVQEEAGGPSLALGAAAARAFRTRRIVRVDPGLRSTALHPMARGLKADLTLREGWPAVLLPLLAGRPLDVPASGVSI